jgi:hypothetical protein
MNAVMSLHRYCRQNQWNKPFIEGESMFYLVRSISILGNAADFSITWLLIYLAKQQAALISNDHYYTLNSTAGKEFVHDNNIPFFPSKYFPSKYDDFSFGLSTAFIHT